MSQTDQVTVIIAARNAEATIARAVRSALAQPEAAEVVLVDDGSRDRTQEQARSVDDGSGRLMIRRLEKSVGPSAARNLALDCSKAPLVAILDGDDYFLDGRLGKLVAERGQADMVADDLWRVTEGREDEPYQRLIGPATPMPQAVDFTRFVLANLARPDQPRCEWGFLKPLISREFLHRASLSYDPKVRLGEDFIFYANALARGCRFKLVGPCGYVAVEREDSLSHRHTVDDLRALKRASESLSAYNRLEDHETRALETWRRQLERKLHYREVLEVRKAKGMLSALLRVGSAPQHASYVFGQSLQDKLRRTGTLSEA